MNGDLIDIIELIVDHKAKDRYEICHSLFNPSIKCEGVECSECLLNTSRLFITDYPIQIIEIKGMIDG